MIKLVVIGIFAAVSAVSAQTQASASRSVVFYAEPSVVVAFPGDFERAVGGALTIGASIKNVHSIEAEVIAFNSNEEGFSDEVEFMPALLTYKYSFVLNEKITLLAGASIGATFEEVDYLAGPSPGLLPGQGDDYYSISEAAFTSGVVGGVSYALNSRVSLDANARLLRLEETDITTAGNMVLFTIGVKVRF